MKISSYWYRHILDNIKLSFHKDIAFFKLNHKQYYNFETDSNSIHKRPFFHDKLRVKDEN